MKDYWKRFINAGRQEQMITIFVVIVIIAVIAELIR